MNCDFNSKSNIPYLNWWNSTKGSLNKMIESVENSDLVNKDKLLSLTNNLIESLCYHQDILENAELIKPYPNEDNLKKLQDNINVFITKAKEKYSSDPKLNEPFDNFVHATINGIYCTYWVTFKEQGLEITEQYNDLISVYKNKILLKNTGSEKLWAKSISNIFTELSNLVKKEYKAGLEYNKDNKGNKDIKDLYNCLGDNFKYYCDNKKFKNSFIDNNKNTLSTNENVINTNINSNKTSVSYKPNSLKNEEFINKIIDAYKSMNILSKECDQEGLVELNYLLFKAYAFIIHLIEFSKQYKKPNNLFYETLNIKLNELFINELKVIDGKDIQPFKDVVSNTITSLYWVTSTDQCVDIAESYINMIDLGGNKVYLRKNQNQSKWIKMNKDLSNCMLKFIKMNYKNGLDWTFSGNEDSNELLANAENKIMNDYLIIVKSTNNVCGNNLENCECYTLTKESLNSNSKCFSTVEDIEMVVEGIDNKKSDGTNITIPKNIESMLVKECSNIEFKYQGSLALKIGIINCNNITIKTNGGEFIV